MATISLWLPTVRMASSHRLWRGEFPGFPRDFVDIGIISGSAWNPVVVGHGTYEIWCFRSAYGSWRARRAGGVTAAMSDGMPTE
ncbi:hypothetical protein ACFYOD_22330 [Streptomyces sp. NPDC006703]|uniref:hypothetical protein n=1 Tax=Streptomyces sp. NPDC006703 TaxID=3364759 RepID=UPI0036CA1EF9